MSVAYKEFVNDNIVANTVTHKTTYTNIIKDLDVHKENMKIQFKNAIAEQYVELHKKEN